MDQEKSPAVRWGSKKKTAAIITISAIIVLALVAGFAIWHGRNSQAAQDTGHKNRVVTVERTSLVAGFQLSGTLGYGTPTTLGGGGGVVTKLPEVGQTVATGQAVMEVAGSPVFLLQGETPLWRNIGPGVSGVDVAMVRSALIKLGIPAGTEGEQKYDQAFSDGVKQLYANAGYQDVPLTEDQKTAQDTAQQAVDTARNALATAQGALDAVKKRQPSRVERLQADSEVDQAQAIYNAAAAGHCGIEGQGCSEADVVSARDSLQVAIAKRDQLSAPPDATTEQLSVSEAQRTLDQAQRDYEKTIGNMVSPQSVLMVPEPQIRIDSVAAKLGVPAEGAILNWTRTLLYGKVDLSDAQRRLLATGAKATMKLPDGKELQGTIGEIVDAKTDLATGQVTPARARIDLADQAAAAAAGMNALSVTFVQDTAENTLVVPVTALMALAEGGYCVERPDGSLVAVEVGLVADTRVQVTSSQLHEGDEVVVP